MIYTDFIRVLNNLFPVAMAKARYKKWFKEELDLDNPQDLNAKILWQSLFADTREWSRLSDKYAVREFVKERGCEKYLVKLYGKWDRVEDIDWDSLPNEFIFKSNTLSGHNIIVRDKSQLDIAAVKKELEGYLGPIKKAYSSEWQYQRIKPCVIAEELLNNDEEISKISTSIIDYKIWCFNGKPYTFFIGANRTKVSVNFYDYSLDWVNHPEHMVYNVHDLKPEHEIPKPKNLDEMLEVAKTLSAGFPLVRVDLYNIGGRIYFGEMTFTSNGGIQPFYNYDFCKEMGRHIDISMVKKDPKHWRGKGTY